MDGQNFNQNNNGGNNYQDNTNMQTPAPNTVYGQQETAQNGNSSNSLAIISLVMGILSIVACCCGIGFIFSIAGIICGISANKKGSSGMATAGIICSIVGIVLSLIAIMYYVILFAAGGLDYLDSYYYYY
ncbi:MAG: DUF4190 domain-containing protein [Candidatus Gastranaerophilales bacterium]|nr:DUF4190 domain-containing protein [Candidatus Gastranaerophilales bacterium]